MSIRDEIVSKLNRLKISEQKQVLAFTKSLLAPKEQDLLHFATTFDQVSLQEMKSAIEACEKVDTYEW